MNTSQKSAAVYRRNSHYFVHANLRTPAGFWIASVPASLLPVTLSAEELGASIIGVLAGSVQAPSGDTPLLAIAKVRSWRALQRSAALCNVWRSTAGFVVEPTRNGGSAGDGRGYHPLSDQSVAVPAEDGPGDLGAAVVAAFERCC